MSEINTYALRKTDNGVICTLLEKMVAGLALIGTGDLNRLGVRARGAVQDSPSSRWCNVGDRARGTILRIMHFF